MRKWMRERLQRRKKKASEEANQPAPPPLQPAYFEDEAASDSAPEPAESDSQVPVVQVPVAKKAKKETEIEPIGEEPAAASEQPVEAAAPAPRARGRRRRGGRGRGGEPGRKQAVAEAFAPAAGKGIIPELPAGAVEEPGGPESSPELAPELAEETQPETEAEPAAIAPAQQPQAPAVPTAVPVAPARPPKGIVVLAIGLPGSGKSSWFKRHNVAPLSSDTVRSLLFDDVREQRFQDLVFSNLRSMLKARLIAKRPMNYVDATNLTPQERQHWIKLAKDYHYEVHAVFFDVPLEVCIERHQRRDRVVPEDIMRRMAAKLKPPSFEEGFAKITVVRVKKKEAESA
jgi:predicted kinase